MSHDTTSIARATATITYDAALRAMAAAAAEARRRETAVSIAVTDPAGTLVAFARLDGAPLLTVDLAVDKAYTAVLFGIPSGDWFGLIKDGPALMAAVPIRPRLVILAGGLPIRVDGALVGGIGVSGGTPADDEICARAGVSALGLG